MLDERRVHLMATDAHDARKRPPLLAEAREAVARRWGGEEADRLVVKNPLCILENVLISKLSEPAEDVGGKRGGFWRWARRLGKS
jgi:protein-tyrosine phosphatase